MLRTILVDDEPLSLEALSFLLNNSTFVVEITEQPLDI